MLCGNRDAPRMPPKFCRMSMCLIAMSSDFLDIVLPNPFSSLVVDREGLAG
jgi:hypothetical protein